MYQSKHDSDESNSFSFQSLSPTVYYFSGGITPAAAGHLHGILLRPGPNLTLLIDTHGGSIHAAAGFAHQAYRLRRKAPLHIRVTGSCFSAGVVLLQAGALRTAVPSAAFFVHPFYVEDTVTCSNAQSLADSFTADLRALAAILARRTKRSIRFWSDFLRADRYFTAHEALRLRLLDAVY